MTDISREAVEALRSRLVHQCNAALSMPVPMTGIAEISRQAEEMVAALRAEVDALEDRAYRLGYAICGGEDAPGLVDSIETEWLESTIAKERAYARDEREALEAKLAERVTVKPLAEAMEDLLGETRGVLPESADAFYDYQRGEFTEARILSAITTTPITPAEAAKVLLEWANDMASEDDQRAIMAEIDAPFQHFEDALRAIAQEGGE